jgi:hypothetical protein
MHTTSLFLILRLGLDSGLERFFYFWTKGSSSLESQKSRLDQSLFQTKLEFRVIVKKIGTSRKFVLPIFIFIIICVAYLDHMYLPLLAFNCPRALLMQKQYIYVYFSLS